MEVVKIATPTLDGTSLGGCKTIAVDKLANIIALPLPTGDSDESEVFDMLGVVKNISLSGEYQDTDIATTKAWVDSIEGIADGNQTTVAFVSDQTGTINVMVASVNTRWKIPGFVVEYDIKLIQGNEL